MNGAKMVEGELVNSAYTVNKPKSLKMARFINLVCLILAMGADQLQASMNSQCSMEDRFFDCRNAGLDSVPTIPPEAISVDLSFNNIKVLRFAEFANLTELGQLTISFNNISVIESGTFASLDKLVSLILSNNSLTSVTRETFQGLDDSLEMLGLDNNPSLRLEKGTLQSLHSVASILLKGFKDANAYNFSEMPMLDFLALPDCKIQSLEADNFLSLPVLSTLDLAGNNLGSFPTDVVATLLSLKSLNLEYNNITKTVGSIVADKASLETLNLDYNKMESLHPQTFEGMTKLSTLTLTYNEIQSIPVGTFNVGLNNQSTEVHLEGNPLSCDCNMRWILSWLKNSNHLMDDAMCFFPQQLYKTPLASLTPDKFACLPESVSGPLQYNVSVGSNLTIPSPFTYERYTHVSWFTACDSPRSPIIPDDTYSFGANSSLVVTDVTPSLCTLYECEASNFAGKATVTISVDLQGVGNGPNYLVIALSVGVGVVGVVAIIALACHFSRVRKYSRALRMMRYYNLSEEADA